MIKRLTNTNSESLYPVSYINNNDWKPNGLWYSINDDWRQYCRDNAFNRIAANTFQLTLNLDRILIIDSDELLQSFINLYSQYLPGIPFPFDVPGITRINWTQVTKDYAGVEFQNFNFIRYKYLVQDVNHLPTWYYSLECSSGCLWDLSSIVEFKKHD